jgi:cephalosporin hydroxylase
MSWRDIPGRTAMIWIYDAWIASNPPQNSTVIECGVALGKSVAYLCERLDAAGRGDVQVYAVDPLCGTHMNGEQAEMAGRHGGCHALYAYMMMANAPRAFERVRLLRATSLEASRWLLRPQLVVLDDDHGYEAVRDELRAWTHAEWIGGDDMEPEYPGVERAVREQFGNSFEFRGQGGPWDNPTEYNWGTWLRRGQR